jgi:hypothetical protein
MPAAAGALEIRIVAAAAIGRGILPRGRVKMVKTALRDGVGSHFRREILHRRNTCMRK